MSNNIEAQIRSMGPKQMKKAVARVMSAGLVAFMKGSPGIGKSSIVRALAEEFNLKVIDHRLSTSAPEDLSGLPHFDEDGSAVFAPFADLFPLEGCSLPIKQIIKKKDGGPDVVDRYDGWLLFLDEFNSAHKDVQAAAYKLVLDKMTGQHKLHERVIIVCAGNKDTDRAIVNKIGTAMQSRVITLELDVSFEEWLTEVALPNNYDGRIIAYLSMYPAKLMDFKPDHEGNTFCCPRTWEFMNSLILNEEVTAMDAPLFGGTISASTAVEFISFCQLYKQLVTIGEILKDPKSALIPPDNALKWSTITHLFEKTDKDNIDDVVTYILRYPSTFQVLFLRGLRVRKPELQSTKSYARGAAAIGKYLF